MYVYGCDFITLYSDNHTDTSVAMRWVLFLIDVLSVDEMVNNSSFVFVIYTWCLNICISF